jgi:hypothetical protein
MTMTHLPSIRSAAITSVLAAWTLAAAACSPDSLVKSDPPSNILMPGAVTTPAAATALYNGAASMFASAFGGGSYAGGDGYVRTTATATDELAVGGYGEAATLTDLRNTNPVYRTDENIETSALYTFLQTARINASQARQGLEQYGAAGSTALVGRMYALQAYTVVMLAEYFCNGVPLSETPLEGETVLSEGVGTDALLARAIALFDTAITLSADSANFVNMAKVGKGRALLDQGQFAEAAAAVDGVPLTFAYLVHFRSGSYLQAGGKTFNLWNYLTYPYNQGTTPYQVLDREGGNGLPWSTDPRVPLAEDGGVRYPAKYTSEASPIRLADGIEASLIRAEAAFQADPTGTAWLDTLNSLRANCTSASGCAPVAGIVAGTLAPVPDSGTAVGRVRELMAERAYWMFATGHRQGDLRRLLRPPYSGAPYSFTQSAVYPSGAYTNSAYTGPTAVYGSDVVAVPALAEEKYNTKYHGCFDLNP